MGIICIMKIKNFMLLHLTLAIIVVVLLIIVVVAVLKHTN